MPPKRKAKTSTNRNAKRAKQAVTQNKGSTTPNDSDDDGFELLGDFADGTREAETTATSNFLQTLVRRETAQNNIIQDRIRTIAKQMEDQAVSESRGLNELDAETCKLLAAEAASAPPSFSLVSKRCGAFKEMSRMPPPQIYCGHIWTTTTFNSLTPLFAGILRLQIQQTQSSEDRCAISKWLFESMVFAVDTEAAEVAHSLLIFMLKLELKNEGNSVLVPLKDVWHALSRLGIDCEAFLEGTQVEVQDTNDRLTPPLPQQANASNSSVDNNKSDLTEGVAFRLKLVLSLLCTIVGLSGNDPTFCSSKDLTALALICLGTLLDDSMHQAHTRANLAVVVILKCAQKQEAAKFRDWLRQLCERCLQLGKLCAQPNDTPTNARDLAFESTFAIAKLVEYHLFGTADMFSSEGYCDEMGLEKWFRCALAFRALAVDVRDVPISSQVLASLESENDPTEENVLTLDAKLQLTALIACGWKICDTPTKQYEHPRGSLHFHCRLALLEAVLSPIVLANDATFDEYQLITSSVTGSTQQKNIKFQLCRVVNEMKKIAGSLPKLKTDHPRTLVLAEIVTLDRDGS